ncbi:acid phosphatase, class B-like protein [Tanacetum coccineum]
MPHSGSAGHKHSDLDCLSWRLAVETNNLQKWKQVPEECETYVGHYMLGEQYRKDVDLVPAEAYEAIPYNATLFNAWVEEAAAPAIPGALKLYKQLLKLGFKIVFLTGTEEAYAEARTKNMMDVGYTTWEKLIYKGVSDGSGVVYKSAKRKALEEGGYRIRGNMGDQWSDLLGSNPGDRVFKVPDPMYYIDSPCVSQGQRPKLCTAGLDNLPERLRKKDECFRSKELLERLLKTLLLWFNWSSFSVF